MQSQVSLESDFGKVDGFIASLDEEKIYTFLHGETNLIIAKKWYNEWIKSLKKISLMTFIEIKEEARGQGEGKKLVEEFVDFSLTMGAEAVVVLIPLNYTNFDLLKFYENLGFRILEKTESKLLLIWN